MEHVGAAGLRVNPHTADVRDENFEVLVELVQLAREGVHHALDLSRVHREQSGMLCDMNRVADALYGRNA